MYTQLEPTLTPCATLVPGFRRDDEFQLSFDDAFEAPAPVRFLLGEGGFLFFALPGDLAPRLPEGQRVNLRRKLEPRRAILSFAAEVYRMFLASQLGVPVVVLRVPDLCALHPEPAHEPERRASPRASLSLPVCFWRGSTRGEATLVDISSGGLLFEVPAPCGLHVADGCVLELRLPSPAPAFQAPFDAEVVRVEPLPGGGQRVAVRFLDLMSPRKQKDVWTIDAFVAGRLLG